MRTKKTAYLLLIGLILFVGCKEKPQVALDDIEKFRDHIFEVSSGIVSAKEHIKVVLTKPMKDISSEVELDASILEVSPEVPGKVMALNNRTVAFIPSQNFKSDTRYTFELDLGALQDVDKEFETFVFDVRTIKQEFHVDIRNLESYSKDWQYLNGVLTSSDILSISTAQKLITASQKGKALPVKMDSSLTEGKYFKFKVDSIQRFDEDSELNLKWDGTPYDIEIKGDFDFDIPGKNTFKVIGVNVYNEPNRYIEINFSDPIEKTKNLNGLISLERTNNLSFSVENNLVKVYMPYAVLGQKKLVIRKGLKNIHGFSLKSDFTQQITFEELKPNIKLLQNGTILPTSENLRFNFEAVNLKAVDVTIIKIFEDNVLQFLQNNNLDGNAELLRVARPIAKKTINLKEFGADVSNWRAYSIDLKEIINPDPGAIYRVELNFRKSYSNYSCASQSEEEAVAEETINYDAEETETSYWDSPYYTQEYDWNQSGNPCDNSYYRNKRISTNILASNIGVTVKQGKKNSYFVGVSDIITTNPIANAEVKFYNYQQQLISIENTDIDGKSRVNLSAKPYFVIVTKNNISSYVKLNDGNTLSVSKFDVSGAELKRGLKGYIYGERGVWRPGDTLHLSFMLNDKNNKLPQGHPVKMQVFDPYGEVRYSKIQTDGLNNFYRFTVPTVSSDYTGDWMAKVSVGGAHFTKTLKIETIKPNRLKIKTRIEKERITSNTLVKGDIEAVWLHGAIAKNLGADINVSFNPVKTSFKAFPSYEFDDPTKSFSTEEMTLFDGEINDQGKALFSFKPNTENNPAGMLRATFVSKVYEDGGDFSTDAFAVDYASYDSYVGLLAPKGDAARDMLLTDTKHKFEVATVDAYGKPKAVKNLKVAVYKINSNWWWNENEDNLSSFDTSSNRNEVFTKKISTASNGKGIFEFELKYPDWGRFLVYVANEDSGHATGKMVFIDWPGWAGKARKGDPSAATMLSFSTDKTQYNVGEKALVTFPSSGSGRALVTIENGSKVIDGFWVKASKGDTKFELPITEEMTPNVYISISLLQNHNNTKNDLPIRMYGVTGITVENPETKLEPKISMPNVLAPEETVSIKVSETNGKAMTYSLAIVDEGLLDLTRFKTPNPWSIMYQKEALGVKTWDIYDDIIGAFGGNINQVFSIGGDDMLEGGKNKKANRFKPVVIYEGPFALDENSSKTHKVKIPKYIGSVRTMVVAHNPEMEAYGEADKATPVRKPLMVLASMARKVVPGEKVRIPVTVFAMEKKMKTVKLSLKSNEIFKVIGKSSKTVSFQNPDEKMAYFDVEVLKNGIGKIEVLASGHGEKASYRLELDAYNPNPESLEITDLVLPPNTTKTLTFNTFGVTGSNHALLELSAFPSIDFTARLQYLIRYPHGCAEQTTSGAFPQLYLNDIFKISEDKKKKTQKNIQAGINKLSKFQKSNGGFAYWQNQNNSNDWTTSYVGHFMLEGEKKGFVLPINFKNNWVQYQRKTSERWNSTGDQLAQAYRLYTLALAGQPNRSAMNRLRELENLKLLPKLRLAATYGITGKDAAAEELLRGIDLNNLASVASNRANYGSKMRNLAMVLETYVVLKKESKAKQIADTIAKALTSETYMSTQTTSYCLLAMSKYATMIGNKGINVNYAFNNQKQNTLNTNKAMVLDDFKVRTGSNSVKIKNNKNSTVYVRLLNNGILPIGSEKSINRGLSSTITFTDKAGNTLDVSKIQQGTNFVANIRLENNTASKVKDVALSAFFPSGWEIVNTRFTIDNTTSGDITFEDIRDDRVNYYFDLKESETKTFTILLNASYLGSYYRPGMQGEAMYDENYFVRTKGTWVEVVE
ncbi:MAG: MG2 domain-containing protein [Bacteroidota bacterium]